MDIASLLAPYRSKPVTRSDSKNTQSSATSSSRIIQFTAKPHPASVVRNLTPYSTRLQQKGGSSSQQIKQAAARPAASVVGAGGGSKFNAYHRKQNLKFAVSGDAMSQAAKRRIDFNEGIKGKREKAMNTKREGISEMVAKNKETPVVPQKSQMEKLQRWKREKAELLKQQKQVKKPPMTVGIPQRKPNGLLDVAPKSQMIGLFTKAIYTTNTRSAPGVGNVKRNTPVVGSVKLRVAPVLQIGTHKIGKAPLAPGTVAIESISAPLTPIELKDVLELFVPPEPNENENVPPKLSTMSIPNIANSPAFKKVMGGGGIPRSPTRGKAAGNSPAIKKLGSGSGLSALGSPSVKKPKKPKGMQLDGVYREFNSKFVSEATVLSDYVEKWTKFLQENVEPLPEDVVGDIESSIGQARLLFESKLPQFAELLYFYLSKTENPHPVLPCDLEGWWAVAVISIEKVKDRFVKLEKLSRNRWQPVERVPLKSL